MSQKHFLFLLAIFYCTLAFGQSNFKSPDNLSVTNQHDLIDKIEKNLGNKSLVKFNSKILLDRARANSDWGQMVKAYGYLLHATELSGKLNYADSMVYFATRSHNTALLAGAYVTRGNTYYNLSDPKKALDDYLMADKFIDNAKDEYLKHKIKFHIGQTKFYLGFYDEAIALFRDCMDYFVDVDDKPYLSALHGLGLCYNRIHQYEKCTQINAFGISETIVCGDLDEMITYFKHSEGVNQYFRKNYRDAIEKLLSVIPALLKDKDFTNVAVANFYIAKSYLALSQESVAMGYLHKVDAALIDNRLVTPDLRESFELQINHYKSVNNIEKELYYSKRLIHIDELIGSNYKYLSTKILREYNTKELIESVKAIELSFVREKQIKCILAVFTLLLILTIALIIHRHIKIQKQNRLKFDELISKQPETIPQKKQIGNNDLGLGSEVIDNILEQLEKFELEKKFLKPNLTQVKLAAMFKTNTTYLSKIIPHYKGKKTNHYINDLKIEYILELLKSDSKYKNYTFKALGEEVGFTNPQHFARAFEKYTEISLSFFIQELKKQGQDNI